MNGGKRVRGRLKIRASTEPKKRVRQSVQPPPPSNYIVWRLGVVDLKGLCSWLRLESGQVAQLQRELHQFEKERLDVLKRRRWLKFIGIEDMTYVAQNRLREISAEPDGLWQLHLAYNKWRVWGYYDEPLFHIVWWDPDHDVCTGKSVNRKTA